MAFFFPSHISSSIPSVVNYFSPFPYLFFRVFLSFSHSIRSYMPFINLCAVYLEQVYIA